MLPSDPSAQHRRLAGDDASAGRLVALMNDLDHPAQSLRAQPRDNPSRPGLRNRQESLRRPSAGATSHACREDPDVRQSPRCRLRRLPALFSLPAVDWRCATLDVSRGRPSIRATSARLTGSNGFTRSEGSSSARIAVEVSRDRAVQRECPDVSPSVRRSRPQTGLKAGLPSGLATPASPRAMRLG